MKFINKKVIYTVLASILGFALLPSVAQAVCYINGPIVRVIAYDDSYTSTGCYIYMRSGGPMSSVYYYAKSNDDNLCTNATIALTSSVDVGLSATAATCPTTGTARFMGAPRYMWINP